MPSSSISRWRQSGSERLSDLLGCHTAGKWQTWDANHFGRPSSWLLFSTQTLTWNSHFHPSVESWNGGFLWGPLRTIYKRSRAVGEGWKRVWSTWQKVCIPPMRTLLTELCERHVSPVTLGMSHHLSGCSTSSSVTCTGLYHVQFPSSPNSLWLRLSSDAWSAL